MLTAVIVTVSVAVAVVAALFAVYLCTFFSPHKGQNDIFNNFQGEQYEDKKQLLCALVQDFSRRPFQRVEIRSFDGLKLVGRLYFVQSGAPLVICQHGYRGWAIRDCCGGGKLLVENGFNVLVTDQRAQGGSGGHTITFGEKERLDCLSWVNYATKTFGSEVKIVLYGISMGATTVLLASELNLPKNVVGIVADCPYTSPRDIICKVCGDMHLSPRLGYPIVWMSAKLFGRFNPSKHSAVSAVKRASVPILLIHGEADRLVPCEMSKKIAQANPSLVRLEIFPNAAHGISYLTDGTRYEQLALDFMQGLLKPTVA